MKLCHIEQLIDGASRGFDPHGEGRDTLFVVRQGNELRAYLDACPHHDTPMAWRKDAYLDGKGIHIVCSAHGAQFEIGTGLCTLGPCLGDSLTPVALVIHNNGEVHLAPQSILETTP